jgi:hypothetical protein
VKEITTPGRRHPPPAERGIYAAAERGIYVAAAAERGIYATTAVAAAERGQYATTAALRFCRLLF